MQTSRKYPKNILTFTGKIHINTENNLVNQTKHPAVYSVDSCVHVDLIFVSEEITSSEVNLSSHFIAKILLEKCIKYKTVLTGIMYLRMF